MLSDSRRKLLLILFVIFIIIAFVFGAFVFYAGSARKKNITKKPFNVAEFSAQMEFINNLNNKIEFLTYRNSAVASLDSDGQNFKAVSPQILPRGVETVYWFRDGNKILIRSFDSNLLAPGTDINEGYKLSIYTIGENKTTYLPGNFHEAYLIEDRVIGLKNREFYLFANGGWKKTNVTNDGKIVIASKNQYLGILKDNTFKIYDKDMNLIRSVKTKLGADKLRFFSSGSIAETYEEKVVITKENGKKKTLKLDKKSQILFGNDILLYVSKNKSYAYLPLQDKIYSVDIPQKINFINLYGLSDVGAIYFTGEGTEAEVWKF